MGHLNSGRQKAELGAQSCLVTSRQLRCHSDLFYKDATPSPLGHQRWNLPKLLPPGCLQTKLWSHSLGHLTISWSRDCCSPDGDLGTGCQAPGLSELVESLEVTQWISHLRQAQGS